MKRNLLFLAFLFTMLNNSLFAQVANSQTDATAEIAKNFSEYYLVPIRAENLYDEFVQKGNNGTVELPFSFYNFGKINWQKNELVSENYQLVALESYGERVVKSNLRTYHGVLQNDPSSKVAITISDEYFAMMIHRGDEYFYIEPAERFSPELKGSYVLYKNTNYIGKNGFTCAHDEQQKTIQQMETLGETRMATCYRVQWAIASDFKMYAKYNNSVTQVEARTLTVLNNSATDYIDQFVHNYKFKVEKQLVAVCANCLNVSESTDADDVISTFTQFGNGGGFGLDTDYDIGQFYSARDFTNNGSNGVIGYASVGAVCSSARYQIIEDFSTNADYMRVVVSHETGHNFNIGHDNAGTDFIMAPYVSASKSWSTGSKTALNIWINSLFNGPNNCLTVCPLPNTPPTTDFKWLPSATCVGRNVSFEDASDNDPASYLWTFQGGTPATSTIKKPSVIYNTAGVFDVTLKATNAAGSTIKERKQLVFVDSIKTNFCTITGTGANNAGIKQFKIGDMNAISGGASTDGSKYMDFTCSRIATLSPNTTYEAEIAIGDCASNISETYRIWIDYNNDGDFNDANEEVAFTTNKFCGLVTSASTAAQSLAINIPANVVQNRIVRCRVMSLTKSISNQPCYNTLGDIGQIEDYGIIFKQQFSISALKKDITCSGGVDGNIKLFVIGGTKPYTYKWSNPALTGDNPQSVKAGDYTVTVTDFTGATLKKTVRVLQPSLPITQVFDIVDASCDEYNGTIFLYAGGGGGTFTYQWSNGGTVSELDSIQGGKYFVTITDNLGCSVVRDATVKTTPAPKLVITGEKEVCKGAASTINVSGADSYIWDTGTTATQLLIEPFQDITYFVTGFKGECAGTDSIQIKVGEPITTAISSNKTSICAGESVDLTAINGGKYAWSGNTGTGATISVAPTTTTNYTVTVTNLGCKATASKQIVVNQFTPAANSDKVSVCAGQSATLTASGGVNYLWSNGKTTAIITETPSATTTYTVTITSGACTKIIPIVLTVGGAASVSTTKTSICQGESTTISATGGGTYTWSNNQSTAQITVSPTNTTSYTVTVTKDGCNLTATQQIVVNQISATAAADKTSICAGKQVVLTASGGATYNWSNAKATAVITETPNATATYSVTVTAANGCSKILTVPVTVAPIPAKPTLTTSGATTFCDGGNVKLTAPAGFSSYVWSNAAPSAQEITVNKAGVYTVSVKSAAGCESVISSPVNVVVNPNPAIPTITVKNPTLTSSATAGNQWYLNGQIIVGATAQTYAATKSGKYKVIVTVNGCSSSSSEAQFTIGVQDLLDEKALQVFPNPASETLSIRLTDVKDAQTLVISNVLGQQLINTVITNQTVGFDLNIATWAKGTYLLQVRNKNNEIIGARKVVKM